MSADLPRYFDYAATTPIDREAARAMLEAECEDFGNTSSPHIFGARAARRLEVVRTELASLLGAERVIFTGTGTEADNLALLGAELPDGQILVSQIEHKAVSLPAQLRAERDGRAFVELPVDGEGQLRLDALDEALQAPTALVSVMHANNEMGALQPLQEIAARAHAVGARVHSDAIQTAGKLPLNMRTLGVDFLALSAHKFYGPKGVGALALAGDATVQPVLFGGAHQAGLRPGTEDVGRAVGLLLALKRTLASHESESARLAELRAGFERRMQEVDGVAPVGAGGPRLPHICSLLIPRVAASALIDRLSAEGFGISSGSACNTGEAKASKVMLALGMQRAAAKCVVRISLGRHSDAEGLRALENCLRRHLAELRALAP